MEGTNSKSWLIMMLVLAALLGLGGGVVGQLVSQAYIMESYFGIPGVSEINFPNDSRSSLVISGPKKVVVEQNDKVYETAQSVRASLAGIYLKKVSEGKEALDGYYQPSELAGQALVLSSDGWLITNFKPEAGDWSKYEIAANNKELLRTDKQINDSVSGLTFVHVPANNLPVRSFADPSDLQSGQIVLSASWAGINQVNMITEVRHSSELVSLSDKFNEEVRLADAIIKEASSPAVFNLAGEVVGFVNDQNKILPAAQFRSVMASILLKGKIERPSLGLAYVNLSELVPGSAKANNQPRQGAVIVKTPGEAERKIGLKEGDIVTQVGAVAISDSAPLNEALQSFKVGDKVVLVLWREGKQEEIVTKANLLK